MRSRVSILVVTVVAAVGLAACGGHGASPLGAPTTLRRPTTAPGPTSVSTVPAGKTMHFALADAAAGPVTVQVPSTPIGTEPTDEAGLTLELFVAQRVDPRTVEVVFALHAASGWNFAQGTSVERGLSANGGVGTTAVSAVALFDPGSMKEYLTYMAKPSDDTTCLCSQVDVYSFNNPPETAYYAALIAAPPAGDNRVSFVTGLATIADVNLTGS
jgi:hypothetical protein